MAPAAVSRSTCEGEDAHPQIERTSIGKLKPNPNNPRRHSTSQLKALQKSIRELGFIGAIVTDEAYNVLAGHGRLEAAKQLGLRKVPVIRYSHLSPAKKRALILADNKLGERSGWDREALTACLSEADELLRLEGLDFSLTGFEVPELDALLADFEPSPVHAEDDLPVVPRRPVTRRGDLWMLSRHRLMCGDARVGDDLIPRANTPALSGASPTFNATRREIGTGMALLTFRAGRRRLRPRVNRGRLRLSTNVVRAT
jgi:ParB-like chromosome segregation protein Spo0J